MLRKVLPEFFVIKYGELHKVVCLILRAKLFFNGNGVADDDLIVHLPLPLHAELAVITDDYEGIAVGKEYDKYAKIFGIRCVPGYENRICMSNPNEAFLAKSPVAIIEGFSKGEVLKYRVEE